MNKRDLYEHIKQVLGLPPETKILSVTVKTEVIRTIEVMNESIAPIVPRKPSKDHPWKKTYRKKRSGGRPPNLKSEIFTRKYGLGDGDLTVIKMQLTKWKDRDKLNENEMLAMSSLGEGQVKKWSDIHKQQLLDIFNGVRSKILKGGKTL